MWFLSSFFTFVSTSLSFCSAPSQDLRLHGPLHALGAYAAMNYVGDQFPPIGQLVLDDSGAMQDHCHEHSGPTRSPYTPALCAPAFPPVAELAVSAAWGFPVPAYPAHPLSEALPAHHLTIKILCLSVLEG